MKGKKETTQKIFTRLHRIWKRDNLMQEDKIFQTEYWIEKLIRDCFEDFCFDDDDYYLIFDGNGTLRTKKYKIEKPRYNTLKQFFYYIRDLIDLIFSDFDLDKCKYNWVLTNEPYYTYNENIKFLFIKL